MRNDMTYNHDEKDSPPPPNSPTPQVEKTKGFDWKYWLNSGAQVSLLIVSCELALSMFLRNDFFYFYDHKRWQFSLIVAVMIVVFWLTYLMKNVSWRPVLKTQVFLGAILIFQLLIQSTIWPNFCLANAMDRIFNAQSNQIILEPGQRTIALGEGKTTKEIVLPSANQIVKVTIKGKGELMLTGGGTVSLYNIERWQKDAERRAFYITALSPLEITFEVTRRSDQS